ncbi:MAG: V-type ATP synthase subunit F [Clostridia bacterium]|nr:V-type ATP synthase subunit F [Clostridia bacterium]
MAETKIAVIGDRASVIIFSAVGITVKEAETPKEAEGAVMELVQKGYKIIYITEVLFQGIPDLVEKYRECAYPSIIPIPDRSGSMQIGEKNVIHNMEKAIGTNIFDK